MQQRPFLRYYAGEWAGHSLKFRDNKKAQYVPYVEGADVVWVGKDKVTTLKLPNGPLPIEVAPTIGKTDKRLSRLFGTMPAWYVGSTHTTKVGVLEVGAASALALDGAEASVSWSFAMRCLRTAISEWEGVLDDALSTAQEAKAARTAIRKLRHMTPPKSRVSGVYLTGLLRQGELKGHGVVVPDHRHLLNGTYQDIIVLDGAWKEEVRFDEAHKEDIYFAWKQAKKAPLRIDVQNLAMHQGAGFWTEPLNGRPWILEAVKMYFDSHIEAIVSGSWAEMLSRMVGHMDEADYEKAKRWPILEFVASKGDVRWFSTTLDEASRATLSELRSVYGSQRFPIPGEWRRYLYTDYRFGTSVPRGTYEIINDAIVVNAVDFLTADPSFENLHALNVWIEANGDLSTLEPGIAATLGGMDQDDMVWVLGPVIGRSPTMVGETWAFPKWEGECQWPIRPELLPTKPEVLFWLPEDLPKGQILHDRSTESVLTCCRALQKSEAAIGVAVKNLWYYVLVKGTLPEEMPTDMEGVVDLQSNDLADCREIMEWFRALGADLAKNSLNGGGPLPRHISEEFARSTGKKAGSGFAVLGDDSEHWFDVLMDGYQAIRTSFGLQIKALKAAAMPPLERLEAFAPADAGAAAYRQHYGKVWRVINEELEARGFIGVPELPPMRHHSSFFEDLADAGIAGLRREVFEGLSEECETFLRSSPEDIIPDVLGATLRRIYSTKRTTGAVPNDFIVFQRGQIRAWTIKALRNVGVLAEPAFGADGRLQLMVEDDPRTPKTQIVVYDAWACLEGYEPPHFSREETVALKGTEYGAGLVGHTLHLVETVAQRRTGPVKRYGLVGDRFKVGSLPMRFEAGELTGIVVEHVLHDGGRMTLIGEGLYEGQLVNPFEHLQVKPTDDEVPWAI